jgi:hypothetical protein
MNFLRHRIATEEETREYYRRKSEVREDGKRRGYVGKALFHFTTEQMMGCRFYYSAALDTVMYRPSKDEVFEDFCKQARIESFDKEEARKIWHAALQYANAPHIPDELIQKHREGRDKLERMTPDQVMFQRDAHARRYS